MPEPRNDRPIDELELLRATGRSDLDRERARRAILSAATPLLARRRRPTSSWEVLAGWARPGLVAASIVLAIALGAVQLSGPRPRALDPVLLDDVLVGEAGDGAVLAVLVGNQEPDADAVMAATLQTRDIESGAPRLNPERDQR